MAINQWTLEDLQHTPDAHITRSIRTMNSLSIRSTIFYALSVAVGIASTSVASAGSCPNVHIILDRSGSMSLAAGTTTRWALVAEAVNDYAKRYDTSVRIGFSAFPKIDGSCNSTYPIAPNYHTSTAIKTAITALYPNGSTPTASAIQTTSLLPAYSDANRKHYFILLTDGGPGCAGAPDTVPRTVDMIRTKFQNTPSITTFVVGIGDTLSMTERTTLADMAKAGGKPVAPTDFYAATDKASLTTSLDSYSALL